MQDYYEPDTYHVFEKQFKDVEALAEFLRKDLKENFQYQHSLHADARDYKPTKIVGFSANSFKGTTLHAIFMVEFCWRWR